jgi:hypothetical protein
MVDIPAKTCPIVDKLSTQQRRTTIIMKTKTCTKCNETKPSTEFKRRLTLAQTRALLKQPNATTRFTTISKHCKACREKKRSRTPLTAKEIRTRMTNGDMPQLMGEMKLAKLRAAIPQTRSRVMKETWQKRKAKPYETLKRHLQDQVNRIGNRHFASKNLHEVTQIQNKHDYIEARRIMKDLLEQAMSGTFVPNDVQIAPLIKPLPTKEKQHG